MPTVTELLSPLLRRPLVCLTLLWVGGIVLATHLSLSWGWWVVFAAMTLLLWIGAAIRRWHWHALLLIPAVSGLAGGMTAWQATSPSPGEARYLPQGGVLLLGYPVGAPIRTAYGWHVNFRVTARRDGQQWRPASGTLYLAGRTSQPRAGQYAQVLARVQAADDARNPYGFSWRAYLAEWGLTARARAVEVVPLAYAAPASPLAAWRGRLDARLAQVTRGPYRALHAQLLDGLLLGVHGSPLADTLVQQFRRAGTIHLLVVSGSQVALLAACLFGPLVLLGGRSRTSYPRVRLVLLLLSLPLLGLYVALADRGLSVDRAVLMGLLTITSVLLALSPLARRRSYRVDVLTLLAAAALLTLIARPAALFSPSLQLSYAAVLGLCTLTPVVLRLFHRLCGPFALYPAATLGAQLMTYPVLAWHFGAIPVLAPLTNLLAVPLVALLLPLGLLTLVSAMTLPPLAVAFNAVNIPLLSGLIGVSTLAARCPWAEVPCYTRSPWGILLYLAVLAGATLLLSRWLDRRARDWAIPAGREPRMW